MHQLVAGYVGKFCRNVYVVWPWARDMFAITPNSANGMSALVFRSILWLHSEDSDKIRLRHIRTHFGPGTTQLLSDIQVQSDTYPFVEPKIKASLNITCSYSVLFSAAAFADAPPIPGRFIDNPIPPLVWSFMVIFPCTALLTP